MQAARRHASRVARGGSAAGRGIRRLVGCYLELGRPALQFVSGYSDK